MLQLIDRKIKIFFYLFLFILLSTQINKHNNTNTNSVISIIEVTGLSEKKRGNPCSLKKKEKAPQKMKNTNEDHII